MAGGFVLGAEQGPSDAALVPERRFYTQSAGPTAPKPCLRRHVASHGTGSVPVCRNFFRLLATETQGSGV